MNPAHRASVLKNLTISMLKAGKINTTLAKAKWFAPYMEKMITLAKQKDLAKTRLLASRLDKQTVAYLYEIAKKMENRNGGYTRIKKTWMRYGDASKTAMVEFVF
jgi:large subunit ribosomal protein L17